jgi:trigger factor
MDIKLHNTDDLNAVITIDIKKDDYQPKVDKILKDYRKTANIPGFRKGHVPLGLIKRQFGKSVMVDEVNKLLQESLNNYIVEEKLDILGQPLPKTKDEFDWDSEDYQFEFELGLTPNFDINLKPEKPVVHYKIEADTAFLDDQVKTVQKQFGKLVSQSEVKEGYKVVGKFENEAEEIDNEATITLKDLEDEKLLLGAKVGDAVVFKTASLFKEKADLAKHLGINAEKAEDLDVDVTFTISEINEEVPAELNEELFKKVYPNEEISTEEELRNKFKEEAEKHFESQSDQQLLNDVSEFLIESADFDLPSEFLQKWLRVSGEKELTEEEAQEQFEKSEKGFKFQLIEQKIVSENNIKVEFEEIKEEIRGRIEMQMSQFGGYDITDDMLDGIVQNMLKNQEETKKVSDQVLSKKLIEFYKNNVNLEVKKVNYKQFIDEVYK